MTKKQKILVIHAFNKQLNSPLLDMWVRKNVIGEDLRVSQLMKKVPSPSGIKQDLVEQLWVLVSDESISGLEPFFDGFEDVFSTIDDWKPIQEKLKRNIKLILP